MHLLATATGVLLAAAATAAATVATEPAAEIGITFSPPVRCNATQRSGAPSSTAYCPAAPGCAGGVGPTCPRQPTPAPPTPRPTPSCEMTAVVGCFQWPRLDYTAGFYPTFKGNNSQFTQETCADACCAAGYGTDAVSAVALHPKMPGGPWALMGADCYCATAEAFDAVFASARRNISECDQKCPGNKTQSCGGAPLGPNQKLLVSRASCQNCAAAPAPPTAPAVGGVRPAVGAENVFVHAGICCLWNGKCRAHCHPNCHVHDVPNSVNSTRTVVYRNWSTQVSTAIIADANNYPQSPEGPNENAVALLADNKTIYTVMRLGAGDFGGYYSDYLQSRSVSQNLFIKRENERETARAKHLLTNFGCNFSASCVDGRTDGRTFVFFIDLDGYWKHVVQTEHYTWCRECGPEAPARRPVACDERWQKLQQHQQDDRRPNARRRPDAMAER